MGKNALPMSQLPIQQRTYVVHDETPEGKSDCLAWVQQAGFPKGICVRCGWPTAPQDYHAYGECIEPPRVEMPPEFALPSKVTYMRLVLQPLDTVQSGGTNTSVVPGGDTTPSASVGTSPTPAVQADGPTPLSASPSLDSRQAVQAQPLLNPSDLKDVEVAWGPDPDEHLVGCKCEFCQTIVEALQPHIDKPITPEEQQAMCGTITKAAMAEMCRLLPELEDRRIKAERNLVFGPDGAKIIRPNKAQEEKSDE